MSIADLLEDDPSDIAAKITALGGYVKKKQAKAGRLQWTIQCPHPQHPDTNPSATLAEGRDGTTLMYCFGGTCSLKPSDVWFRESVQRIRDGIAFTPAKPRRSASGARGGGTLAATYRYFDAAGSEYHKVRYEYGNGEKRFEWRTITDVSYVSGLPKISMEDLLPYGSEHLADHPGQIVYWVEGEKDADRAHSLGLLALSSPAGATGPLPDLTCLAGRVVTVIADRDPAGLFHAREVMTALESIAAVIGMSGPAPMTRKSDLSDHLDAGYGMDALQIVIPPYAPGHGGIEPERVEAYENATVEEPDPPLPGLLPDTFWDAHPALEAIRDAAYSRMLRPEPILAACLVTAATCTSPLYVLPPIVGAQASLNLFGLLYGSSGMGKSTSLSTGRQLLGIPHERWDPDLWKLGCRGIDSVGLMTVKLGSGEGIAHAFAERVSVTDSSGPKPKTTTRLMRVRDHALIADAEGSALAAHQSRSGATIGPVLLSAFSGEALLSAYSKRGQDNAVDFDLEPLSYRLGIILGIQPDVAGHYLDQAGIGWPQRLLWTTVHGPLPDVVQVEVEPIGWKRPPDPMDQTEIDVDDAIAQQLRDQMRVYRETGGNPLDSHAGLLRLKVAAAFHVLLNPGQHPRVTLEDWRMAGEIVAASDLVREQAQSHVTEQAKAVGRQRAEMKAHEQVAAQRATERDQVERVAKSICRITVRHQVDQGDEHWCSGSACLRRSLAGRDRAWFEDAIEYAVERNLLEVGQCPEGTRYRSRGGVI
jgi:hypothetical protein